MKQKERIIGWDHLVIALIAAVIVAAITRHTRPWSDDWASIWLAATMVARGDSAHIYDLWFPDFSRWSPYVWQKYVVAYLDIDFKFPHPYVHIPLTAYVLAPLTKVISFKTSVVALQAANAFCVPLFVASAWHFFTKRTCPTNWVIIGSLLLSVTHTWVAITSLGQTTPLIMTGVMYALVAAERHPVLVAVILAPVAVTKLTPMAIIALFFFFPRRRKTGIYSAIGVVLAFALSWWLAGSTVMRAWISHLRWISGYTIGIENNISIDSLMLQPKIDKNAIYPTETIHAPMIETGFLHMVPRLTLVVVLGAILLVLAFKMRKDRAYEILGVGGFGLATIGTAIVWNHYLYFFLAVVIGIVVWRPRQYQMLTFTTLAVLVSSWWVVPTSITAFWVYFCAVAILLLFFFTAYASTEEEQEENVKTLYLTPEALHRR